MVKRPASVVKELVENAIDAGTPPASSQQLKTAGRKRLQIRDNGHGMRAKELVLALSATHLKAADDDLLNIRSLGFA